MAHLYHTPSSKDLGIIAEERQKDCKARVVDDYKKLFFRYNKADAHVKLQNLWQHVEERWPRSPILSEELLATHSCWERQSHGFCFVLFLRV